MINIFKRQNEMSLIGQGGKIMLFTLPSLLAAIWLHLAYPSVAALPPALAVLQPLGYLLLAPGLLLWAAAVIQLLTAFQHGKLVTTGAYGVVRNPIYASVALFVLPSVSLLTMT